MMMTMMMMTWIRIINNNSSRLFTLLVGQWKWHPRYNIKSQLPLTDQRDAVPRTHRAVHRCQCDKLVINDGHQLTKLTVHLS